MRSIVILGCLAGAGALAAGGLGEAGAAGGAGAAYKAVTPGRWQHVALVCDARFGGCVRFYVDGKPAGEQTLGLGHYLDLSAFRIGAWNRWQGQAGRNYHGEVDDIRIYRGMLTAEQVAKLAAPSLSGKESEH